jgi:hypothetical protein
LFLQNLLPEALGLLQTRRTTIEHHDQIPKESVFWALWAMQSDQGPNGPTQENT